jgi:uncharacterized protein
VTYKHGVFGEKGATIGTLPPTGVATLPVYIGTAPVQQLADASGAINTPIIVNSFDQAKAALGYSDDWKTFTLCEAMYAHFRNRLQPIGPIVLINVMDPALHDSSDTESVAIVNGVGYINEPVILSSVAIEDKALNTDYKVEYVPDGRVKITALTTLTNPSTVTFDKMDVSQVQATDIIGGNVGGVRSGASVIELVYVTHKQIPTILAAPGWSHLKTVKEELVARAQKINGHWDAAVAADLVSDTNGNTIAKAIAWKATNGYTDRTLKVGWPKAKETDREYWSSTLMVVRMQQTDYANGNVPYVSPSNKQVDITAPCLADGSELIFDEIQANLLNEKGITTFNFRSGIWVLWGPHNANYEYGAEIDPENIFDASIRMMMYLTNGFQDRYLSEVDGPLNRSVVDTIINDSGTWLNSLVSAGQLLYGSISFNETSNPTSSIVQGDFVFDVATTTTPVAKSMTFIVRYTTEGLSTLFGGES